MADIKNDFATNVVSVYMSDAEGLLVDLHGSNTLTNNNTVTTGTSLKQGTTGQFVAASSQYLTSASTDFDFSSTFSICGWFRLDTDTGTAMPIATKKASTSPLRQKIQWEILNSSLVQRLGWRNTANSSGTLVSSNTAVSVGTIFHAGISFNANAVTFYLNGSSDGGGSGVTGLHTGAGFNLEIGGYTGIPRYYDGRMNQLVISTAAENASWFSGIYNGGDGIPYEDAGGGGFAFSQSVVIM